MPGRAAEVADVGHLVAVPEHGMDGGEPADRLIAMPLMPTIWPRALIAVAAPELSPGSSGAPASPSVPTPPDETADLRRLALRVVEGVLGPADDLATIVGAGREAVRAAERGQRSHHAVLPPEAEAAEAGAGRGGEERRTAPVLLQRVRFVRLRDAGEHAAHVLDRPAHDAVPFLAAERAEIGERPVPPQRRMASPIVREVRAAGYPAAIVDAEAGAGPATKRWQLRDLVPEGFTASLLRVAVAGAGEQDSREHREHDQAFHLRPPLAGHSCRNSRSTCRHARRIAGRFRTESRRLSDGGKSSESGRRRGRPRLPCPALRCRPWTTRRY